MHSTSSRPWRPPQILVVKLNPRQEALLGKKKELAPLRPEKQIYHYTLLSLISVEPKLFLVLQLPSLLFQLFPKLVPKCKVAAGFVVSGMEALYSPEFCSLLQIHWTCELTGPPSSLGWKRSDTTVLVKILKVSSGLCHRTVQSPLGNKTWTDGQNLLSSKVHFIQSFQSVHVASLFQQK